MIALYIIGTVLLIILLILIIPLKIKIKFSLKTDEKNKNENLYLNNYIKLYILGIIRIKKIKIKQKNKNINNSDNKLKETIDDVLDVIDKYVTYEKQDELFLKKDDIVKLKNNMKYKQFYLDVGVNFKEVIINSYIIAIINSLINMYIGKNADIFNLSKTQYNTYISNKVFNIDFFSIINLNLVHTIIVFIKLVIVLRKVDKSNGKRTSN